MLSLLNRGLNFSILHQDLDITLTFSELKRFERSMIWREYWYSKDVGSNVTPIFKKTKKNLPRKYTIPSGFKNCMSSIKSELLDPKSRNIIERNIPKEEVNALHELIQLQKEKKIIIKQCDKGAGILILNYEDYIEACYNHLNLEVKTKSGEAINYYEKVNDSILTDSKKIIRLVIEEGLDNELISREEFEAMVPDDKKPGRFYCTFKVHKPHEEGSAPPVRPIISGSGSTTENVSLFVEHYIKQLANKHPTFIQDRPYFLRCVEKLNEVSLPDNSVIVTMDVSAFYTNIPKHEGLQCTREALEERNIKEIPTYFLVRLLELVLEQNIFEYDSQLYKQTFGTAMGARPAPSYANLFMARRIDIKIFELVKEYEKTGIFSMKFFKRFLDDLIFIFCGSTEILHNFFEEVNNIHETIKFTFQHTSIIDEFNPCRCPSTQTIPFLDTSLSIQNGKINVDLYRKPTDKNQYLLPTSCHPSHVISNIPFSLAMRIVRICTDPNVRDIRLMELKHLLIDRNYSTEIIDTALNKARGIPRDQALKHVAKPKCNSRPVFAVTHDPRLPNLSNIITKHWRSMTYNESYLKDVFPSPPLVAYKKQPNLRNFLIRAKVPQTRSHYTKRLIKGMKKCNKPCAACPFIMETKQVKCSNITWTLRQQLNCNTSNIIYLIECNLDNCKMRYIGETERPIKNRILEHVNYVKSCNISKTTGEHFNQPGHSISNISVTVLEKVKMKNIFYRKERESYLIKKFNTQRNGLNKLP